MSLDQRCQQFHEAALGTGKSKGSVKEIATLRKFLHKNQDQRFTDRGVSRLFDTIQLYYNKSNEDVDLDVKEGMLEDALKMPFTLFSTKQKNSMMKWLEDLRGASGTNANNEASQPSATQILTVIDISNDGIISLMDNESGDTYDNVPLPKDEMGRSIRDAFANQEHVVSLECSLIEQQVDKIIRVIVE